jgi:hypothetical protein
VTGKLSSSDAACVAGQTVNLLKGGSAGGSKVTSATGGYSFAVKITKKTTLQVMFPGTPACGASQSPLLKVRLT